MIDLIGPELRIGNLEGNMGLSNGAHVILGHGGIPAPKEIFPYIKKNQEILLDDGKIKLTAEQKISESSWRCKIICGGVLTAHKSIAMPLSQLPRIQAHIARVCRKHNKDFMIVTQMLDSMIKNPYPTRAEVNDIYHAVTQGASALMLTGETAHGKYPVEAMKMLVDTAEESIL